MPLQDVRLVRRPTTPPVAPGDDPRWGDPAVAKEWGDSIRADVIDTVTHATHTERALIDYPRDSGPIPDAVRGPFMLQHRFGFTQPYHLMDSTDAPGYVRPVFELRYLQPGPVDDLFNHPGGMRGHYAVSPHAGDAFTGALITMMIPMLQSIATQWRNPRQEPSWMETDPAAMRASLEAGKVWTAKVGKGREALTDSLRSRRRGNARWVPPDHPAAREPRERFITEVRRQSATDADADAFLRAASGGSGGMGPTADHTSGTWGVQRWGSHSFDVGDHLAVMVAGAFMNRDRDIWTPLRKIHRALSIHWFGFT